MTPYATWREPVDEPKGVLGLLYDDRKHYLHGIWNYVGPFTRLFGIILFLNHFFGWALVLVGSMLAIRFLRSRSRPVDTLQTLPPPGPSFVCDVDVRRDRTTIGTDRGTVTFVDDWLHFEGRRTTFSLRRVDVEKRDENELILKDGGGAAFRLRSKGGLLDPARLAFADALKTWERRECDPAEASRLPPRTLHRSGRVRGAFDLALTLLGIAALGGVAVQLPVVLLFLLFGGVTGSMIDALVAAIRLRRIDRAERSALSNDPARTIGP